MHIHALRHFWLREHAVQHSKIVESELPICPYCERPSQFVRGSVVYPHRPDLSALHFYACMPCDAYVGVHRGTSKPFGSLANAPLRAARKQAHAAFDPLWKTKILTRHRAYIFLARLLDVAFEKAHIGMLDIAQCNRVVSAVQQEFLQTVPPSPFASLNKALHREPQ